LLSKLISSEQAAKLIKDSTTVAIEGFVTLGHPEELSTYIEKRFLETGHPKNLTIMYCAGIGDGKTSFGINHYAYEGLLKRVVCGHFNLSPKLAGLVSDNKIEAYNFPQGVVAQLYRAIAGGKLGVLTHVGLKTFADPRLDGAKMNAKTKEDLVDLLNINGKENLLYKSFPIDVALIRATTADEFGNLTMEDEAVFLENLSMATAAKNSGGIVIAQVKRIAKRGTLNAQHVKIPGILVDHIVLAKTEYHKMSNSVGDDHAYTGEIKVPLSSLRLMEMNERKIIARRSAMELIPNAVVNLGIGMAEGVASIALEEGLSECMTLTVESGPIGGVPAGGVLMGASANPEAIIDQAYQFDFYDGGGLDIAFLGLAQADKVGNINVSKFNNRVVGCGGFINITQNAKKVVFCGTLTAGNLSVRVEDGKLIIISDGQYMKMVNKVEQITFSGVYASSIRQEVLYVSAPRRCMKDEGRPLEVGL
jgi:propionate CoA-transferase